jgi:crotonobetainyl-CoA:carnitine CoA-transferase CaiB-like acyl-CoA transferase
MQSWGLSERMRSGAVIDTALAAWFATKEAAEAAASLVDAGIPAAALADAVDLVASPHLQERGFWQPHRNGVLPALPWRASFGRSSGPAPGLGADSDAVLAEVLDLSSDRIAALRGSGALG